MINDKKTWEALRPGEKGGSRWFYKETQPKLWQWVVSRVQNEQDADEIVQDSFLNLLDSLPFQGKVHYGRFQLHCQARGIRLLAEEIC